MSYRTHKRLFFGLMYTSLLAFIGSVGLPKLFSSLTDEHKRIMTAAPLLCFAAALAVNVAYAFVDKRLFLGVIAFTLDGRGKSVLPALLSVLIGLNIALALLVIFAAVKIWSGALGSFPR